ncbi:AraC family transcriptional regulator [Sphingosinicella sp. CPCC 101087]|uniref:helix-turn-helix transcriptional regulator n=1 Tax=Sphingosinicella sp. CPCC 101087 TaxID=2497754 RepID=UPI00101E109E|nr:AraC family transcriptional regulator [Sphingosinicella sp. CPCC 101087]
MSTSNLRRTPALLRSGHVRRFPAPPSDAATVIAPYALQDHSIDRLDGRQELIKAFLPLSDHHYRMQSIGRYGDGHYECCGLSDGFFIWFGDVNFHTPLSLHMSFPDLLQVHVASHGDSEYVFPQGDDFSLEATNSSIFIHPAREPATEATFAGCHRFVSISIHREVLKALYSGSELELPVVLRRFLNGDLQHTLARPLPLRAALLRCLDDVHACSLEGHHRRLFLQSKAVEILCQAIEALEHAESGSIETTMLTARGVIKAQRFLAENFITPPSLEDLAHEVGLSRSGLCAGFRKIVGRSVSDYTQDLRMQQALAMLSERDVSIAQIAYAVGYNRPSSFSVAVQRHFGATPTELRRRGARRDN